ncbi:MAG: FAD-dependent oxidoreductase [Firmicutes bacterium]|nr:FAD-dependent oxidoreductase [Bacillota bacterium]
MSNTSNLVCRCEEITEEEVLSAIASGAGSVTWVKRFTRAGMGLCQGGVCGRLVANVVRQRTGAAPEFVLPDSRRPPVRPIPISILADAYDGHESPTGLLPDDDSDVRLIKAQPKPQFQSTVKADVVVIGAGALGCAIAYYLAKKGQKNVVVVDKGAPGCEQSGRNPGGIRMLGRHPLELPLGLESAGIWPFLGDELGEDLQYYEMGYLWVASNEEEAEYQAKVAKTQQDSGVNVEFLDGAEIRRRFPAVSSHIVGGVHCPSDAQVYCVKAVKGLVAAAKRRGVAFYNDTTVTGFEFSAGRLFAIITDRGRIEAPVAVLAAGPWSAPLAEKLGVRLPIYACPNQMMVTEPLPPVVKPLVLSTHAVCLQRVDGNVIIGNTNLPGLSGFSKRTLLPEMIRSAKFISEVVPLLRKANIIRSWVGTIDFSEDDVLIMGELGVPGVFVSCGGSGHAFALTPGIGKVMAELIMDSRPSVYIGNLSLKRFAQDRRTVSGAHFAHQPHDRDKRTA